MQNSVPYTCFPLQVDKLKTELLASFQEVLESGQYILGENVKLFEKEFAAYCGTKFAVGVANGTDALTLVLRGLGVKSGDEVITAPNSFIASASAIALIGAKPVFVDIDSDCNLDPEQLEVAINSRTKAIIPVHLTGKPAKMDKILEIAKSHNIPVVEDAAQAIGATYCFAPCNSCRTWCNKRRKVGSMGNASCFSLHPLKNFHAFGDGGVITTDDPSIYKLMLQARNHGLVNRTQCGFWSFNSRLDEVQAAMLLVQLPYLKTWTEERRRLAFRYNELLRPYAKVPDEAEGEYSVYQTYVVQVDHRDELQSYLEENSVQALVHYRLPLHLQPAAKSLGYTEKDFPRTMELSAKILSLPLYPELKETQQDYIAELFKAFYKNKK